MAVIEFGKCAKCGELKSISYDMESGEKLCDDCRKVKPHREFNNEIYTKGEIKWDYTTLLV